MMRFHKMVCSSKKNVFNAPFAKRIYRRLAIYVKEVNSSSGLVTLGLMLLGETEGNDISTPIPAPDSDPASRVQTCRSSGSRGLRPIT
jgi:hypothetical protein